LSERAETLKKLLKKFVDQLPVFFFNDVALLFKGIGEFLAGFELPFEKFDIAQFFVRFEALFGVQKSIDLVPHPRHDLLVVEVVFGLADQMA